MSDSTSQTSAAAPTWRIAPSVPVAIGVFLAYVAVFIGLSSTSGIPYVEWFKTGPNVFRAAVLPLAAGSVLLIAFLVWARWDCVFKDPERLPVPGVAWAAPAVFAVGIVAQYAVADWGRVSAGHLLGIVLAGILVGFAEETLFRGVILRSLRTNLRPEAWVMLISSLWFGFFHLTNLANGGPVASVLVQCVLATMSGVVLYLFRRIRGMLVLGMVAHGGWDMSLFLPASTGVVSNITLVAVLITALISVIVLLLRDRSFAVTPTGVQTL